MYAKTAYYKVQGRRGSSGDNPAVSPTHVEVSPTPACPPCPPQGNLVAVKHVNRKRIELTRKVLFELKHVRG